MGGGFGGYVHPDDVARLETQLERVRHVLLAVKGRWVTLGALRSVVGGSDSGVSARVRDLRKAQFGGYTVERRRLPNGVWQYRIPWPPASMVQHFPEASA